MPRMKRMQRSFVMAFACSVLSGLSLVARGDPYALSWERETPYLTTAAGLHALAWLGSRQKSGANSDSAEPRDRSDVPVYERRFAGGWNTAAQYQSNVLEVLGLAAPLFLMSAPAVQSGTILALYAETLLITSGGVTVSKNWIDRSRPYTYGDRAPRSDQKSLDSTRSLLSGHTAHVAAAMSFSASVLGELYPDAAWAQWTWPGAVLVTAYEGHLRVRAGKHFPSDALVGAVWGGWIGYSVPMGHLPRHSAVTLEPALLSDALGVNLKVLL